MYDAMVPCKKCSNKVPASSLKLDLDLKMVVCQDCIKNKGIHKEIEEEIFKKDFVKEVDNTAAEQKTKMTQKCASCGYKFKIDIETKKPKNCPYCNTRVMSY